MRPPPPPERGPRPSPPLAAQIDRDFGSMADFLRTLDGILSDKRHGGYVYLVCTPDGRLRLVRTPPHGKPRGEVLFRFPLHGSPPAKPPRPDWKDVSDRYDRHMQNRPPYPLH